MTNPNPASKIISAAATGETSRRCGAQRRTRMLLAAGLVAIAGTVGCGLGQNSALEPAASAATVVKVPSSANSESADATPAEVVGAEVARPSGSVSVRDAPNGTEVRNLSAATDFGSQRALLVTDAQPGWLQVLVPGRPNGLTGWIASDGVEVRDVPLELRVDLSARTLSAQSPEGVVIETPVAIGSPEAPTPTGTFSITDKLETGNAASDYGPFALGLSGRSEVLTEFAGGDGQVGIHGTNNVDSIGQNVSHGCIRVPNEIITSLNELLPLGTPVEIV